MISGVLQRNGLLVVKELGYAIVLLTLRGEFLYRFEPKVTIEELAVVQRYVGFVILMLIGYFHGIEPVIRNV